MADVTASPVVVGVDGSTSSLEAVEWAGNYAATTGTPVKLVAAWDWPNSYGWPVPVPDSYSPSADADRVLAAASARLLEHHPSLSVTTVTVQGHPAHVLVDASKEAALLVVGCRGHSQLAGIFIGSVSEHCAARAHCPVVVVRGVHTAA